MKAFFNRLHLGGGGTKDKEKDKEKNRDSTSTAQLQKEKFPPLRSWPPDESTTTSRITSTPVSLASFKPLPELVPSQFAPQLSPRPSPISPERSNSTSDSHSTPTPSHLPLPGSSSSDGHSPLDDSSTSRLEHESAPRNSRKPTAASIATNTDVQKKVAFISPPQSPIVSNLDRALPEAPATFLPATTPTTPTPLKTTLSRFQATHGKEPRGSLSSAASSSKTDVAAGSSSTTSTPGSASPNTSNSIKNANKATSTRTTSPLPQRSHLDATSAQSLRSATPFSQMSANSGSRILAAQSWSEVTEEDLVSNIGSRERIRQEVLFEIISSEDRYVVDLSKMKDTFIDPLLHPFSAQNIAVSSTPQLEYEMYRADSPIESNEHLPPIAARFMSPTPTLGHPPPGSSTSVPHKDAPNIDGESLDTDEEDEGDDRVGKTYDSRQAGTSQASKHNHPRSPYRGATRLSSRTQATPVPFPSRSHQSLPPPPRANPMSASTHSLGRQSIERERERNYSQGQSLHGKDQSKPGVLRKLKKSQTTSDSIFGATIAPNQLPEDLRICLEVIDSGVFDGHKRLSEALKKRYDDQFPLVRSLADVFVSNSDIFQGYATYVLHLERALEQVDDALSNVTTKKPKKQDAAEWQRVCKVLQKLEEDACEKGETGLAISLSKPFQRLLKYPLLFQNLLFHTDPSTFEYESTLQMVAEVETIVRSIEDEKIQKEERDKTRDVFARIEGLDKVKQLAMPKPSRILVEERLCVPGSSSLNSKGVPISPPPVINGKNVRGKSSLKRLTDVLQGGGVGGKKDLWFVVFNDVILQCQRTGTTSLPLVASTTSRTNSMPELQGKSKYATTGRRNTQTTPRNLYKFIKIETWTIGDVAQPREGVVSMEDVVRSHAQMHTHQPRIVPLPDDNEDDGESDDSDRKSKMSFSYWGADKVTVQKPVIKGRIASNPRRGGIPASYGRESSANAKFGSRLMSNELPNPRPSSRRTQVTTPSTRRAAPSDEGPNYAKATVTRPTWDNSTRSPLPPMSKRSRNTSQTSAATKVTMTATAKALSSPAPSEDSGVGLYRQMLANDPSLN